MLLDPPQHSWQGDSEETALKYYNIAKITLVEGKTMTFSRQGEVHQQIFHEQS